MPKAKTILDKQLVVGRRNRYNIYLKVYEVKENEKFPQGIKAKFALINTETGTPVLLIDNHEPYGFHAHKMIDKKNHRVKLFTTDYLVALQIFRLEVERIVKNEK
jgi:hypothetical protein